MATIHPLPEGTPIRYTSTLAGERHGYAASTEDFAANLKWAPSPVQAKQIDALISLNKGDGGVNRKMARLVVWLQSVKSKGQPYAGPIVLAYWQKAGGSYELGFMPWDRVEVIND